MYLTKSAALVSLKAGPDDELEEGEFIGYASVFGNKDSYGDVVFPGAFTEDLDAWAKSGNVIPVLFGHRMDDPDYNLGGLKAAEEDEKGLRVHGVLDLQNPKAAQTYRLLKGRRISQMSFAYDILEAGWEKGDLGLRDKDGNVVEEEYYALRKMHVHEVSLVPIGANQETEIVGVKTFHDLARRAVVDLKAGRVISKANETKLRTAYDSLGEVLSVLDEPSDDNEGKGKASGTAPAVAVRPDSKESGPAETENNPSVDTSTLDVLELELKLQTDEE